MSPPRVLICRAVFVDVVQRLRQHFEVHDNPTDTVYTPAVLTTQLSGMTGAFTTGSERIDATLLAASPGAYARQGAPEVNPPDEVQGIGVRFDSSADVGPFCRPTSSP